MKIFFDTNVYIAAALLGGMAERVVDATHDARWRVYASDYLLGEIERVLAEKLGLSRRLAALARNRARRRATSLVPVGGPSRHLVPGDPDYSPILQAAVACGADYLVTNDVHLLAMHPYQSLQILSITAYRDLLRGRGLL